MDNPQKDLAYFRMKESEEAFRSGEAMLKIDDCRGAINRFYYAAFYATQALLILRGKDAKTHSGNLYLFREEFIRTGVFPAETNDTLSSLMSERIESDYAAMSEPTREEVETAKRNCETFLNNAKEVFKSLTTAPHTTPATPGSKGRGW